MTEASGNSTAGPDDSDTPEYWSDRARDLAERRANASENAEDTEDTDDEHHSTMVDLLRRGLAAAELSAPGLLASTHLDRGERRLAAEVLGPAVHTRRRDDLAGLLAETLAELGDHDGAEAAFLVGLDAADASAMNGYGLFLWGRGRTQEASYVLDRAARAGDDLAPLNLVTLHLEELDDPGAAAAVAAEFHDEARPSTVVALADVRLAHGRHDDAEALYRRAVELRATCAHIYYGWFLQDCREDLDGAEEQLRLAWDEGESRAPYHLGRFLFDAGRVDDAQPWFEEAAYRGDTEAQSVLENEYGGSTVDPYDD